MIKLIVSSFYNTLINKEEAIPFSTMLEIERIRKKGIVFSVCTNNLYTDVLYYNRDFPFLDYIISLNGSYVYDVKNDKCLFKKKLAISLIKKIIKSFPHNNILYYSKDKVFTELPEDDIYKIDIEFNKTIDIEDINNLDINCFVFFHNNKKYLEITSNTINNYTALDKIMQKRKIKPEEVEVIVANESELPLVENIKNSYTVSNASKVIKKHAKGKTSSNNSKGVEKILKQI